MNDRLTIVSILLLIFYMGWFMWEQRELIEVQNEKIKKQNEVILQMDQLIETQFKYIEKFTTPRYSAPESPIYKSI